MTESHQAHIGMDIGGTSTVALALDPSGQIEAEIQLPTLKGTQGLLDTVERAVAGLTERCGRERSEFASLGIGIPGQIDHELGMVRHAYNIGIDSLDLGPLLQERLSIPVSIDNDVTAAAIGAAHLMQLEGTTAYLNLGTGLAAGYVIDDLPVRGAHGITGEIGHLAIDPLQRQCPCGQKGCLETVASGSALTSFWRPDASGHVLLTSIAAGDADALAALEHLIDGAATAVRLLVLTLDPHTLVIGGVFACLGNRSSTGSAKTLTTVPQNLRFLRAWKLAHGFGSCPKILRRQPWALHSHISLDERI
ncbi:ROK family protein [Leucobacter coleopterorum]|uniref:ROK family protein n=1 Tax=Leucobacter coleopterorum TaxID=2714933 RepID=UPI001FCB33EC|nr:ROK family protein [Leucobacter coleopterorum]